MEDDGPVEEELPSLGDGNDSGKRDSSKKTESCGDDYNLCRKGSDKIGTDTKRAAKLQSSVCIWAW